MKTALLCLCILLSSCAGKPERPKVRIACLGVGLQTMHMPITLAQSLGHYKEEGLDVTLENLSSNSKTLQALMGGSVDVAAIHYLQTIQMAVEGQRIRSFFLMTQRSGAALLVAQSANAKIHSLADLKGAVIGVPSIGSPTHMLLSYFLQKHGVPPAEVTAVNIAVAASAVAAFESGRIDAAAFSSGDHFRALRRNPALRILMDSSTEEGRRELFGDDYYAAGALAAKQEWLDGNPDTARRLARALQRTQHWIATHTPEEIREKLPDGLRSEDAAVDIDILRWSLRTFTPDGQMPKGAPEAMKRMLDATTDKVRDTKIDLASTWTNDYLTEWK